MQMKLDSGFEELTEDTEDKRERKFGQNTFGNNMKRWMKSFKNSFNQSIRSRP